MLTTARDFRHLANFGLESMVGLNWSAMTDQTFQDEPSLKAEMPWQHACSGTIGESGGYPQ
jgi:hypothetical protein